MWSSSPARAASSTPAAPGAAGFRLTWPTSCQTPSLRRSVPPSSGSARKIPCWGGVEDATTKYGFGHCCTYLLGKGWTVMNYPSRTPCWIFVKGKPAQQAERDPVHLRTLPCPGPEHGPELLSTHDTERALTVIVTNRQRRGCEAERRNVSGEVYEEGMLRLRMVGAIIYTLPGLPCLYLRRRDRHAGLP